MLAIEHGMLALDEIGGERSAAAHQVQMGRPAAMSLVVISRVRMGSSSPRNRERISPCLALISSARLATS